MKDLAQLLVMQKLDIDIDKIRGEIDACQQQFEFLKKEESSKRQEIEELSQGLSTQESEREEAEKTLKLEEERLRKSKKKVHELTKDYEVRAMQREIDSTKRSNSELEEQILGKLDQIENIKKDIEEKKAVLQEISTAKETAWQGAEGKRNETSGDLKTRVDERSKVAAGIRPVLLARYKRIRERQHADAVVGVVSYICQGCFMNVPPQQVNEMLREKTIEACPHCQRLIYAEIKTD